MITVAEAIRILQDNLPEPRIINISLEDAFGRRLAEDINAPIGSVRDTGTIQRTMNLDRCAIARGAKNVMCELVMHAVVVACV